MNRDRERVGSSNDHSRSVSFIDEKAIAPDPEYIHENLKRLDVALELVAGHSDEQEISPEESKRLRRKIDRHLLPLLCVIYTSAFFLVPVQMGGEDCLTWFGSTVQFIDKSTLASTSILGLISDNHLTTDQFNTLSSAFYIGYLVFSWPQNWALQRQPVGTWLTFNIFLWCLFLGLHAACRNFVQLFAVRFLLGASEGSMTAGLMLVCGMFYTRTEIGERLGWVFQCNGLAAICSSFLQFAMVHTSPTSKPSQWQWLMIATSLITLIPFLAFLFFFPDNPTTARFLTSEERILAVRRIQANQNGIETKTWKAYQVKEALLDPKTWLFAAFAGFASLIGGIGVEYSLLINSFGFTTLQTSLLSIPNGVAQIIGITSACYALRRFPNSRAWISVISWIPAIVGCLIEICVPLENKVGHLVGIYLLYLGSSPAFIMAMSWVTSAVSGHTKRTTTTAIFLIGYAMGQILCTQYWRSQYRPTNRIPFGITLMSHLASILLTLILRHYLSAENKRRDKMKGMAEQTGIGKEVFEDFQVVEIMKDGEVIRQKVDKAFLDLTDKENLAFRYVL